ncbi:MAG: DUF1173 family protein [Gemmatimonadaceae bacterium]
MASHGMEEQRFLIQDKTFTARDPVLQDALARVYDTPERPRCLCVPGGIEMYVAKHRQHVAKRMPGTGPQHHATCPSFEPEVGQSGLGELMGESIIERSPESFELRVDFPLARIPGRASVRRAAQEPAEINVPRHRMSLRAVMHFLFERAGFNRWTPAMEGKRTQGVLHKYLLEAAEGIRTKGVMLSERLYVPEPFHDERRSEIAERRRGKLAVLQSLDDGIQFKMALVLGEYKGDEASPLGRKLWLKHMPDAPLFIDSGAWERIERAYGALLETRDADTKTRQRVVMGALIYAKREHTYQIDTASLMLTSENWIPLEGVHEADLIQALTERRRRFVKPLRYDARSASSFPNVLLLDTGAKPTPLHVVSALMDPNERAAKEKALKGEGVVPWVWRTDQPMPPLPEALRLTTYKAGEQTASSATGVDVIHD